MEEATEPGVALTKFFVLPSVMPAGRPAHPHRAGAPSWGVLKGSTACLTGWNLPPAPPLPPRLPRLTRTLPLQNAVLTGGLRRVAGLRPSRCP